MSRIGVLATALVLVFSTTICANDFLGSVEQSILESTIKIELSLDGHIFGCGSATLIKKEYNDKKKLFFYTILTADHVVNNSNPNIQYDNIIFSSYDRDDRGEVVEKRTFTKNDEKIHSYFAAKDPILDVAIIRLSLDYDFFKDVSPLKILNDEEIKEKCSVNTEVIYAGCPLFLDPVSFHARIIHINMKRAFGMDRTDKFHTVDTTMIGGTSGGGVFTSKGELIGFVSVNLAGKMGGFIGLDHVRQILDSMMELGE